MSKSLRIDGRDIGREHPPYIIAELSANHNGSIAQAKKIIEMAKNAGADAIKLQTYRPDTLTLKSDSPDFQINEGLWKGRTLYDLYEEAHMPWDWHKPLFELARKIGITIFSSPFDTTAVDLLEDLNAPAYKIASFEAVDLDLIRYVASTRKPMIISTGMADSEEIGEAIEAAHEGGCQQLALLHCVSGYPAPSHDYNLRTIPDMMERYGVITGLSDHTIDNVTAVTSIAMGAAIIEKHVTMDRRGGGPDDSFSLEPEELAALCRDTRIAFESLGTINYSRKSSEISNVKFRRSLYFVKDLRAGTVIEPGMIKCVRPGYGLAPKNLKALMGRKLSRDVNACTKVTFEDIST